MPALKVSFPNITEIIGRYKMRTHRMKNAAHAHCSYMAIAIQEQAVRESSYTAYSVAAARRGVKQGGVRYPYSRRYGANTGPLGDDRLINVQDNGAVKAGWFHMEMQGGPNVSMRGLFNSAPYAKWLFCREGTKRMRPRPLWELLAERGRRFQPIFIPRIFEYVLQDADVKG